MRDGGRSLAFRHRGNVGQLERRIAHRDFTAEEVRLGDGVGLVNDRHRDARIVNRDVGTGGLGLNLRRKCLVELGNRDALCRKLVAVDVELELICCVFHAVVDVLVPVDLGHDIHDILAHVEQRLLVGALEGDRQARPHHGAHLIRRRGARQDLAVELARVLSNLVYDVRDLLLGFHRVV